jgi:hypothetical protein
MNRCHVSIAEGPAETARVYRWVVRQFENSGDSGSGLISSGGAGGKPGSD